MQLGNDNARIIFSNFHRYCTQCKAYMQPLSTMCRNCGLRAEFTKVDPISYIEHFEMKECPKHGSYFHYCIHPAMDSELEDLLTFCVICVFSDFELLGKDPSAISTPGTEIDHTRQEF